MTFRLTLVFAALVFLASLVASTPLVFLLRQAGLERAGLQSEAVTGGLLGGELRAASFRGMPLGDVKLRVSFPALLRRDYRMIATSTRLGGAVLWLGRVRGVQAVNIAVPLSELGLSLPLNGMVHLENVGVVFKDGTCANAVGKVRIDQLSANLGAEQWSGPELSGPLQCKDGEAYVRAAGSQGGADLAVEVRLGKDGVLRVRSTISGSDPVTEGALRALQFQPSNGILVHTMERRLL